MKEKHMNFGQLESYGENSYEGLWNKGLNPMNSLEIHMEWAIPLGDWRKISMRSYLIFSSLCLAILYFSCAQTPLLKFFLIPAVIELITMKLLQNSHKILVFQIGPIHIYIFFSYSCIISDGA